MESSSRGSRRATSRRWRVRPWRRCERYSRTRKFPRPVTTSIMTGSCCGGTAWSWPASSTTRCSRASCSILPGAPMPWPSSRASGWESRCRTTPASWAAGGGSGRLRRCPWQRRRSLSEKRQLPGPQKTTPGAPRDVEVSERLAAVDDEVPRLLIEYGDLAKLKSTYVDDFPGYVTPATGRIHTSFNQAGAATGRLSSSDPNLQNIPVRTPRGEAIRRAFVAAPAWLLLTADYSQIQLRRLG